MRNGNIVVGIVGWKFGVYHLQAALVNGYEISAICDLRPERLEEWGE